jgi:hypothetical protein
LIIFTCFLSGLQTATQELEVPKSIPITGSQPEDPSRFQIELKFILSRVKTSKRNNDFCGDYVRQSFSRVSGTVSFLNKRKKEKKEEKKTAARKQKEVQDLSFVC